MPKSRVVFVCSGCGQESAKWQGKCPGCGEWNTLFEQTVAVVKSPSSRRTNANVPQPLTEIEITGHERIALQMGEVNRVLGGGLVPGSLSLVGGEPGIGKSTLLLQVGAQMAERSKVPVLYVSGEETRPQIKMRAKRLGINGDRLYILNETDLDAVIAEMDKLSPGLVVIDSIQTVYAPDIEMAPGGVSQVRECAARLVTWAKASQTPVMIAGHVTKDGAIAGPRLLEHIVDTVLYLEGEPFSSYRILRSVKNRYGSVNEVGIFEMKEDGLRQVENPSEVFLSRDRQNTVGSAVVPVLEGSRPLLVEIQALTNMTSFGQPRRTANGLDFGRLLIITAVLSRRAYLKLGTQDVIASATGGLHVDEPAADLAVALAIASSYKNAPVDPHLVAIGELGLSGEIRNVPQIDRRLAEADRLGFRKALVPAAARVKSPSPDFKLIHVRDIRQAIREGLTAQAREEDLPEETL
ncbi:DNA repair protein RadA [Dehalogenimonas etheniformans]|uniref:DNA repair protein RadA n=1 Tax=Dehalogenimonas etheniformans TaxID=1536648 RepID=A0A2P5P793_9CHLR|nr:DNA repair protein RadA [Dehalogenimonas etheniformans]PPD58178.1 DNA repair protein RadA [Dehalogenimonas etheniformans]QNT75588.1 DNA repair protein RadA [Dehalogenimonas etheniformans]